MTEVTRGTLNLGEYHPAADIAMRYIKKYLASHNEFKLIEALASAALSGNRLADIAGETLFRVLNKQPVSDRYLMGLAWVLWELEETSK